MPLLLRIAAPVHFRELIQSNDPAEKHSCLEISPLLTKFRGPVSPEIPVEYAAGMVTEARENPPPRSRFAVWSWPRWTWGVAALLVIAAYALSPAPVFYFLEQKVKHRGVVYQSAITIYWPLIVCRRNIPAVHEFYTWEGNLMFHLDGRTPPP